MKKKIIIFLIVLLIIFGVTLAFDTIDINKKNENVANELVNKVEDNVNQLDENNIEVEEGKRTVQKAISPRGFIGSSLKKVTLYSNGDVYIVNYDGSGYGESNITSKELIAKGVSNIEYKGEEYDFEAIVIKGKDIEKVNTNYVWIEFEK